MLANAYHLYLQPGPDIVEQGGGLGKVHELARPDVHRFRRIPGALARRRVQEGPRDERRRDAVRRRHRPWQEPAGHRRRRRRDVQVAPRRFAAPVLAGDLDADPAPTRRGHHLRLRRMHHADEHPDLPGAVGGPDAGVGGALHRRTPPADAGAGRPAVPGVVRRRAGRAVRGPAPAGDQGPGHPRLRRVRHRRRAGEAQPRHHRAVGLRGAPGGQATAPARDQRAGRHVHRHRERRRHLRLRLTVPGGPQRLHLLGRRPVQPHQRPLQDRLRTAGRRLRLLHLRELHPRLRAPPVPREGNAVRDAVHHPQRAVRGPAGRPASGRASRTGRSPTSGRISWAGTTPGPRRTCRSRSSVRAA